MQDTSPSDSDHGTAKQGPQGASEPPPPAGRRPAAAGTRRRAIPRWLLISVEAALGVVAGLVILGGIAIWRLSSEPVRLDFLTPYIEQALDLQDSGLSVEVGETLLLWEGWPRTVDLRARRILIRDAEGIQLAWLPDVSVTLSLRALLQGTVAPTFIEVIGPELTMERSSEGKITVGTAAPDDAEAPEGASGRTGGLRRVLDGMLIAPDPDRNLSFLKAIRVRDGRLRLRDVALDQEFQASGLVLELRREDPGIGGEMSLQFDLPDQPVGAEAAFTYDRENGATDLAVSFAELRPASLPGDWPGADIVRGLGLALGGSLTLTMSETSGLEAATFDFTGAGGTLDLGDRLSGPLPLRALRLSGTYDGRARRVVLQNASLDFGLAAGEGPSIGVAGNLDLRDGGLGIEAGLRIAGMPADDLPLYWPPELAPNAREWIVENVKTGIVEETLADIVVFLPDEGPEQIETFQGSLRYRDLDIHYLRPIPPVRAVSGSASFNADAIHFAIAGGRSGEIELGEAKAAIEGLSTPGPETMSIAFPASGPLSAILTLLNHDRLKLVDKLGFDPADTGGFAQAEVTFNFPLLEDLSFDDMLVSASGQLEDVAIKSLLLEKDATEGQLGLSLNGENMRVIGKLKLGGVPMEIDWREAFTEAIEPLSHYEVLVPSMDQAAREDFGFQVIEGLTGPVSASVVADARRDDTTEIQVALNLEQAGLALPEILWEKPAGEPGEASVSLLLRDGQLTELDRLEIEAGSLSLKGRGRFDEQGEDLASLQLDSLRFAGSKLTDVTLLRQGLGQDIRIGGGVLDAEPFLDGARDAPSDPEEAARQPPLRLRSEGLQAVYFGEGRYLERVAFDLERLGDEWNRIQVVSQVPQTLWHRNGQLASSGTESGQAAAPRHLRLDYRPVGDGRHSLDVESNDTGAALRALDLLDTMEGGNLKIIGEALPGEPLNASLEMLDFTMVDAPALARLLLVASLTGIVEGLSSDGIGFDRMVGNFSMIDEVVTTDLMRAYGGSLGLTAKGTMDYGNSKLDISGTIVPAYGLNRILGEIPLIGTILTGGEGEGVVAFTYDMTGPLEEPRISVNPLSALAPGWLRGIFSGSGKGEEPTVFPDGNDR